MIVVEAGTIDYRLSTIDFSLSPQRHEYAVSHAAQDLDIPFGQGAARDDPPPVAQGAVVMSGVVEADRVERAVPVLDGALDVFGGRPGFSTGRGILAGEPGGAERNGDGVGDVQRREVRLGRQPEKDGRVGQLLLRQAALLGTEDERHAALAELLQETGQLAQADRAM